MSLFGLSLEVLFSGLRMMQLYSDIKRFTKILIWLILSLAYVNCSPDTKNAYTSSYQDSISTIEQLVLREKQIGKSYHLKVPVKEGILEYSITYIGEVKTLSSSIKLLHIKTSSGLYEDSRHSNSRITLFSDKGLRIGHYYLGSGKLKLSLQDNDLVVLNSSDGCDQSTIVSFKDSIPKSIFIQCNEVKGVMYGDIYTFVKRED